MKRLLLLILILVTTGFLTQAVLSLPQGASGLAPQVFLKLGASGVRNPVTAVLLNFRGYDTLLEVAVLLLAVTGVLSVGKAQYPERHPSSGPILKASVRVLLPFMLVVAAYLLWAGKHAPGGAFQAGAVIGAGGVLWLLNGGHKFKAPADGLLRAALTLGMTVFLTTAVGAMATGGRFLEYPRDWAGSLILLVESALTFSIGVALAVLFAGGRPSGKPASPPEGWTADPDRHGEK